MIDDSARVMEKETDMGYLTGSDGDLSAMCAYASEINQIWCCNPGEQ